LFFLPQARSATIVIDPAHGGTDVGSVSESGEKEKDVVLDTALLLKECLIADPELKIVLTRNQDKSMSLVNRVDQANSIQADIFISLHADFSQSDQTKGPEILYNQPVYVQEKNPADMVPWDERQNAFIEKSRVLAQSIASGMADQTVENRGVRQVKLCVYHGLAMPMVVVELGFLSNRTETGLLSDQAYRKRIAEIIAAAVKNSILPKTK